MFTAHEKMEPTSNMKLTTSATNNINNNINNNNTLMMNATGNEHNQINGHGHGVANGGNESTSILTLNGANNRNNNNIHNIKNNNNNNNNNKNNNNNIHHNNDGTQLPIPIITTTTTLATPTTPLNIGYTNGGSSMNGSSRRDSASQVLTPLLQCDNNEFVSTLNNNNNINSEHVASTTTTTTSVIADNGHGNGVLENNVGKVGKPTALYDAASSNNNEWKDSEEINNLKNELLHHVKSHENNHNHNNHLKHHNNHHHNNQSQNNNGTLLNGNGKNGMNINGEKYNEQDPLTGLYNSQKRVESDESDFDSDLHGELNENDRKEPGCGIFGCRPKWARKLASTHVFMVVFLLAYVLQGMYLTYFVSVITTIEKLFQIKSKTTGLLLSASEMGQISTAMLLTYFAGRGHRPRWIACGMVLFSIAAFSCSLPHFIFGDQLMHSSLLANGGAIINRESLSPLQSSLNQTLVSSVWQQDPNLCLAGSNNSALITECDEERKLEQASQSKITWMVLCIFFVSLLSSGVGQTAVATLGIPYIDDNVASKQSPMYMAITIGVRILGPASGFIVGSFCTRRYVNLTNPGFSPEDPRWIGAWWLGPVIIGSLMMCVSIAMFSFPKQLHGKRSSNSESNEIKTEPEETPKLRDFPKTVRRQLSNDILMFRTASCVFHLLPVAGLYTFLPKYLESQFRLAPYDANMIAAFGGILVMGVGIVIAGLVILKLKPSARSVAAWIAFTALVYSAGMVILMFVGCSTNDFAGYGSSTRNSPAVIQPACTAALNCTCDKESFAPICGIDGKMYISSCHAGCSVSELRASDNKTVYANCACITDPAPSNMDQSSSVVNGKILKHEAVSGYCESGCKNFIIFVLIFVTCVFMHSTSEVGSMLLVMRCTHPKDKAMAMGIIQSAIGLFGNVPCPILYGAVVDSACLIWKSVCGKHGACSLYDADTFRHYFLGITASIMFLAFIMDVIVWKKAHRIDIAPEENVANTTSSEPVKNNNSSDSYKKTAIAPTASPDTSV